MKIILDDFKIKYKDPNFAISIAHNLVQHDRTKHIEIHKHFIKKLDSGLIATAFRTYYLHMYSPRWLDREVP